MEFKINLIIIYNLFFTLLFSVKIAKTSMPITTTESSNHQEKVNHNNNIFEYIQQSLINFDNYPIEDINIDKNEISAIRNFSESLAKLSIRGEIGKLYELTVPQVVKNFANITIKIKKNKLNKDDDEDEDEEDKIVDIKNRNKKKYNKLQVKQ